MGPNVATWITWGNAIPVREQDQRGEWVGPSHVFVVTVNGNHQKATKRTAKADRSAFKQMTTPRKCGLPAGIQGSVTIMPTGDSAHLKAALDTGIEHLRATAATALEPAVRT